MTKIPPSLSPRELPSFKRLCESLVVKLGMPEPTIARILEGAEVPELLQENHDLRAECAGRRRFTSRFSRLQAETASLRDHAENRLAETQEALEVAWRRIGVLEEQLRVGIGSQ